MEFEDLKVEVALDEEENQASPLLDVQVKKYQNVNSGDFVTGFDVTSKEAEERRLRRARRFGIKAEAVKTKHEVEALPSSVAELPKTNKDAELRHDAILLFGVNEMSTKDVFDYFKDYTPDSIEWIDDISCVVVWDDEHSAKRALVAMGTKYTPSKETEPEGDQELVENIWRIGVKCPKAKQLLMRYAVKSDKKTKGAGSRSLYYLVHGHPNEQIGKKRGLVSSSRKRKILADRLRVNEQLRASPEIEFRDVDMDNEDETMETTAGGDVMDVDIEPPAKVQRPDQRSTGDLIPAGSNMYADRENDSKKAQARLATPEETVDEVISTEGIPSETKMAVVGSGMQMDKVSGLSRTADTKHTDLRQKLKNQRSGFNPDTRPNLSIEVTED